MSRLSKLTDMMQAAEVTAGASSISGLQGRSVSRIQNVSLEKIYINPTQHRKYFDPDEQQKLRNSIEQNGFHGSILLRPLPGNLEDIADTYCEYELVYGESRTLAVKSLKWESIPAVVRELNDREVHRIRLDENLVRKDLNPIEEMDGLMEVAADELETTVDRVLSLLDEVENSTRRNVPLKGESSLLAEKLQNVLDYYKKGSLSGFRTKYRKLQRLPDDIKQAVSKSLEWSKATEISPIKDDEERQKVLKWAIENNPSTKEIRQKRKEIKNAKCNTANYTKNENELKKKFYKGVASVGESDAWHNPEKQKGIQKLIEELEMLFNIGLTRN